METYALHNFPPSHSNVHIALFTNVTNAPAIRQRLIEASQATGLEGDKAREDVDFGFVEADLLVSKEHLLTAILSTLLYAFPSSEPSPADPPPISSLSLTDSDPLKQDEPKPKTRSHNLHSELLLLLSPNNNISDSIRRHGISNSTKRLAVVKFGRAGVSAEKVWEGMRAVVDGELVGWDGLEEGTDWGKVDKVYKLSELNGQKEARVVEKKRAAVVSSVAVKNVI